MTIDVSFSGDRADIVLNRPDVLNAMSWELFDDLARAADRVRNAPEVRVVVISGAGRAFSSGIDTAAFGELGGAPEQMIARAQGGFRKIGALPVPTIAAVHGHALGAGLQLALACDLRVAARGASLGLLETKYAIVPDLGGTRALPRLIGPGRAKKMIWLAERIDAEVAHAIGLVEVLVERDRLQEAVDDLAARIASGPPSAIAEVKRLVDTGAAMTRDESMDEEARVQQRMLASGDFAEAMTAFMEGRQAHFENRSSEGDGRV